MSGSAAPLRHRTPPALHALIATNGRYWAAEAEVFSTYFSSSRRSPKTDGEWLARQCYKEAVDGTANRLAALAGRAAGFDVVDSSARHALADAGAYEELRHFAAFAIAHRLARQETGEPDDGRYGPLLGADWPENAELRALRAAHVREHGVLGKRAHAFTEGGYNTLYSAGLALAGGSALDDAIARACALVLDDEWEHMLEGIAGLAEESVDAADWAVLEALTAAQGRCRIRMRNAQFGHPLSTARLHELERGAASPLPFDYARAGLVPP